MHRKHVRHVARRCANCTALYANCVVIYYVLSTLDPPLRHIIARIRDEIFAMSVLLICQLENAARSYVINRKIT